MLEEDSPGYPLTPNLLWLLQGLAAAICQLLVKGLGNRILALLKALTQPN